MQEMEPIQTNESIFFSILNSVWYSMMRQADDHGAGIRRSIEKEHIEADMRKAQTVSTNLQL